MSGKVYITRPLLPEALEFLKQRVSVEINPADSVLPRSVLTDRLKSADAAITQLTDIMDANLVNPAVWDSRRQ